MEMCGLWTIATFVILFQKAMAYVELVEEHGFENTTIRLTCRHLDSIIAIHDANFQPTGANSTFEVNTSLTELRLSLNQRCSGVSYCSYILNEDCPGTDQWGPGNFTIKYACISDEERIKYCNKDIILPDADTAGLSEAYVHNPGYPRFYLGDHRCRWNITAPAHQKIRITILDLSLTGNSETCQDRIMVKDSGHTLYSSCLQVQPSSEIVSITETLEITLTSSATLTPRRGVLFHFTPVGCVLPALPQNAYLIFKNDSVAAFGCCADYAFSDTYQKTKVLQCRGYNWDATLPLANCDNKRNIGSFTAKILHKATMQELIAPIILIIILFGVNAVVLFIIFQYRKRKTASAPCNEEELKTFSVTSGGNQMA